MPYNFLGQGGIVNTGPIEDIYYIDPVTFTQSLIPNNDADAATKFYVDEHILEVMDSEIFNPNLIESTEIGGRINIAVVAQSDGTNGIILTVADLSIESAQLAEVSVSTSKIVDDAVTIDKLNPDVTVNALLTNSPPTDFLPFNSQQLRDVADPTAPQHAATMNYVDTHTGVIDTELSSGFGILIDSDVKHIISVDTDVIASRRYVDSEILAHTGDAGGHPVGFGLDTDDGNLNVDTEVIATRNYVDNILIDTDDLATDGVSMGQTFVYNGSNWIYDDAGSSVSVNGTEVEDPNFIDGAFISFGVNGANITPNIDTDTQLATRRYVDSEIQEHLLDSVGFIGGPGVSASLISGDTELVSLDVDTEFFGFDTEGNDGILTINDDSITRDQIAPLTIVAGNIANAAITGQKLQANTAGDGIRFDTDHAGAFGTITSLSVNFDSDSGLRFVDIPSPVIPGLVQDRTLAVDTDLIATRTYVDDTVDTAITNLIDGAPAALDTLRELAEALDSDTDAVVSLLAADTALGLRIDSEAAERMSVDSDLQSQIDNISIDDIRLSQLRVGDPQRTGRDTEYVMETVNRDFARTGWIVDSERALTDEGEALSFWIRSGPDIFEVPTTGTHTTPRSLVSNINSVFNTDSVTHIRGVPDAPEVIFDNVLQDNGFQTNISGFVIRTELTGNQLNGWEIRRSDNSVVLFGRYDSDDNDTVSTGVTRNHLIDSNSITFTYNRWRAISDEDAGDTTYDAGDGLQLSGTTFSVNRSPESGLIFSGQQLLVDAGQGLETDTDGLHVDLADDSGLEFDNGGLRINLLGDESGLRLASTGIAADLVSGGGLDVNSSGILIATGGVNNVRLASNAVTNSKIANNTIQPSKLNDNVAGTGILLDDTNGLSVDSDVVGFNPNVPDFDIDITDSEVGAEYVLRADAVGSVVWHQATDTDGADVTNFIDEPDTPDSYGGEAGNFPRVNFAEDALEFFEPFPTETQVINGDSELVLNTLNGLRIRRFDADAGRIVFATFTFGSDSFDYTPDNGLAWDEPFQIVEFSLENDDLVQTEYITSLVATVDGDENPPTHSMTFGGYAASRAILLDGELGPLNQYPLDGQYTGASATRNITVTATTNNGTTADYTGAWNWSQGGFSGFDRGDTPSTLNFDEVLTQYTVDANLRTTANASTNIQNRAANTISNDGTVDSVNVNNSRLRYTIVTALNIFHTQDVTGIATADFIQPVLVRDTDTDHRTFSDEQNWSFGFDTGYKTWVITGTDQSDFDVSLLGTLETNGYSVSEDSSSTSTSNWRSRDPYTFTNTDTANSVNGFIVAPSSVDPATSFTDPDSLNADIAGVTRTEVMLGHSGHQVQYYVYTFTVGAGGTLNVNVS